jgi:hypothetical protein
LVREPKDEITPKFLLKKGVKAHGRIRGTDGSKEKLDPGKLGATSLTTLSDIDSIQKAERCSQFFQERQGIEIGFELKRKRLTLL